METGQIAVRRVVSGFRVSLEPPDPAHPDETFPDMRSAWGHAGGIKLVTGRPKVDLTGEG